MSWDNAQLETLILIKSGKILLGNYSINLCKESMLNEVSYSLVSMSLKALSGPEKK